MSELFDGNNVTRYLVSKTRHHTATATKQRATSIYLWTDETINTRYPQHDHTDNISLSSLSASGVS